jgi:ribosomal protein S18 acetylase RimI-like enzyme
VSNPPERVGTAWTFDLRQPPRQLPDLARRLPQVTFRRVEAGSTELLSTGLDEAALIEFDRRLLSGRHCYTAWAGESDGEERRDGEERQNSGERRLAGYGWVSFDAEDVGELELHLQLQPCEAYIWDCYTLPDFRNMHIYSTLLAWILQELHEEGLCRAWIGADLSNAPSQRGIDRAGFLRVADLLIQQDGDQRKMWLEGYPGVPESLVNEARRVYLVSYGASPSA